MATDYQSIVDGGLSNVVDNVDKFIEYPGQDKLDSITSLNTVYSATDSFGDINALDLSSFSGSEQTSILDTLTNMDSLSSSNTTCTDNIAGYITDALDNFMNDSSILDAFKSNNGITDCEYGLGVLLASETHLDDYLGAFDTSVLANTFGRMVNNIAGGIDSTLDFLGDIDILNSAFDAMSNAANVLCDAFLALVNAAAAIIDAALDFLKNLGLLGRLGAGECVEQLLPAGVSDVMDQINDQLAGVESIPSSVSNVITSSVSSIAPSIGTTSYTRPWINPSTVTNSTIGNSNRSLYNQMDTKINSFNSSSYTAESVYIAPTSYGSVAASAVPSISYNRESLTYNPITRNWE